MATVTDDDGVKRHVCDGTCKRICDHCQGLWTVHGMWRWGVQTFLEPPSGGGGLVCDNCSRFVLDTLHGGHPSKKRFDAEGNEE